MENCRDCGYIIDISQSVPLDVAIPVYGYVMPVVVAITTVTNSFVIIALSQRHLRTPTNFVLLSMAIADLLTGLTSLPWFIYYYTLQYYKEDEFNGLDGLWCRIYPYLSHIFPAICHTAAIWLTVFLAIQRYVYVCVPSSVPFFCTPKVAKIVVGVIVFFAFLMELPSLGKYTTPTDYHGHSVCVLYYTSFVTHILGVELFYTIICWLRVSFVHFLPCVLLTIFTYKLARTIRRTEIRKRSWIAAAADHPSTVSLSALTHEDERTRMFTPSSTLNVGPVMETRHSGRSLYATNRMLAVICAVFLIIEIPAAIIFVIHYVIVKHGDPQPQGAYEMLNVALIIRNLLIVLTSPIQFSIYCSMSEQFRLTVRQLFSSKLLFVAQAQATFHGGKRYSLILVDVDLIRQKRFSFRRQSRPSSIQNPRKRQTESLELTANNNEIRPPPPSRKISEYGDQQQQCGSDPQRL